MIFYSASLVNLLYFFFIHHLILTFASNPYYFIHDIAINCGSTGNSTELSGREWIGDTGSKTIYFLQTKGKSRSSIVVHKSFHIDHVLFMNARISSTNFLYTFPVSPGQIFIRLHFYPAQYRGFEKSYDLFSVKAGIFTLLSNFSASRTADSLGVKYLVKEYCMNVDANEVLTLLFSTSKHRDSEKTYAFINGIEIISMPTGLYYTLDGDLGASIVGKRNQFYIDNNTALEMVQRLNIGGSNIPPEEDPGLHRRWYNDAIYLMESEVYTVKYPIRSIKYQYMPRYVAPLGIYQTSWSTHPNRLANKIYNLTWNIPVDIGFGYLIRLHFCELEPGIMRSGQREFSILINDLFAESKADVIQWTGENGIPVHRDYMVLVKGDREKGKGSLLILVQSKVELMDGLINGLEIMKLSNPDNFLVYPSPEFPPQVSAYSTPKLQKCVSVFLSKNGIATVLTIMIALINIVVYYLRKNWEAELPEVDLILPKEANYGEETNKSSTLTMQLCRRFSFADIQSATQNFNDSLVVGKGGFGKVYKGFIDNGANIVAIKRLASYSKQGENEFWMEIETLTKLRHVHLVSLIGYCDESEEMILVYEYMPRGTLGDHLYGIAKRRSDYVPLTWEQRIRICLGAARGLDYLHTGTAPGVIHRDVKDSNILLDENFVAKVSDFGLAKLEKSGQNSYISTTVKGTFGYLDPEYFLTRKLSKKSDVYAFGVVMLVVLCGRPAVDRRLAEDELGLVLWAQERIKEGEVIQIIDMTMRGQISSNSLNEFVELAKKCLHKGPKERPTMAQVVASLEFIMQQNAPLITRDVEEDVEVEWTQSFPSVSEEMSDVGGPSTKENLTHNGVSPKKKVQKKDPYSEADLQRKKDYSFNYKPVRLWPWKLFWGREKQSKKEKLPKELTYSLRRFSFSEIETATHNFDGRLILGREFSRVYKGFIDNGANIVAIRHFDSKEFWTQTKIVSKLRHDHLLSLIGYCDESRNMCLVYEYMPGGDLREHLYGTAKNRSDYSPLTWEQRLRICLGAARGILYLHSDIVPGVVHRYINDSHILLDEKFVAKISNFRYAKLQNPDELTSFISSLVKGLHLFVDPHYFSSGELNKKSDVYSFGVVMLVVLSGKSAYDRTLSEDGRGIVSWAQQRIKEGEVDQMIDMTMRGQISLDSLNEYVELAKQCVGKLPKERPTMAQVVKGLEFALQQNAPSISEVVEVVAHLERSQSHPAVTEEISNIESRGVFDSAQV